MRVSTVWSSSWSRIIAGSVALFVALPLLVQRIHPGAQGYTLGVYIGTGVAVVWYTVETFYLRRATLRANEISVLPLVIARVDRMPVSGVAAQNYGDCLILQNVGKSVALFVRVDDFDIDVVELGTMGMRIESADVIDAGQQVVAGSYGYLRGPDGTMTTLADSLVPYLTPTALRSFDITLSYQDIAGGHHRSTVRLGRGG